MIAIFIADYEDQISNIYVCAAFLQVTLPGLSGATIAAHFLLISLFISLCLPGFLRQRAI